MSATASLSQSRPVLIQVLSALVLGLMALGVLFLAECRAAVEVWNTSTAYGHCYLVLPMAAFLAWERRARLRGLAVQPEPRWALLALPVAAGWFAAERLGIMEGRQLMALAGAEVLVLACVGWPAVRAMLAPLLYLVFLVPFGAFITPTLQHITARICKLGLVLLGIPNYVDDLTIEIPEGVFYVAEACAGLRFLIAAIAFGVFYGLLNFRSPRRRLAFIAASVVVPVVANGLRATGIVVLGHVLGSAEAAAADHVLYGWIFFSVVMLLLVLAGLPLREAPAAVPVRAVPAVVPRGAGPASVAVLAGCALLASGPVAAGMLNRLAAPAPLARMPEFVLPAGCAWSSAPPALPATRVVRSLACGDQSVQFAVETMPPRSTYAHLLAARREVTGELLAEESDTTALPVNPENGSWSLVQTFGPFRSTAVAAWRDGAPAAGGLAGRLMQARDSVFGSDRAPVLVSLSTALPGRLSGDQQRALQGLMRSIIDAQDGLTARLAAVSGPGR